MVTTPQKTYSVRILQHGGNTFRVGDDGVTAIEVTPIVHSLVRITVSEGPDQVTFITSAPITMFE